MSPADSHPAQIGKYRIDGVVGRGAMGVVYLGHHPHLGVHHAIKVLKVELDNDKLVKQFIRGAQAAARLRHDNIVAVYDVDYDGEMPFIVMEYLEGTDLRSILDDQVEMSLRTRLEIAYQVARALEFAHTQEIVHRDVKPSNVFLLSGNRVKLVDFGIAKLRSSKMTLEGSVMGTPHYMSPEQWRGAATDLRADVFAFGILMFELLTGDVPWDADNNMAIGTRIVDFDDPAPPLETTVDGQAVPKPLAEIVARCLEKRPEERPESLQPVISVLYEQLQELPEPDTFEGLLEEQVRDRLERARELLQRGELRKAREHVRNVPTEQVTLADEVRALQAEIDGRIEAKELIDAAQESLASLDYEEAENKARKAHEMAPDSREAKELLERVRRVRKINELVNQLHDAATDSKWDRVVELADRLLELDPEHGYARRLKAQAEEQIQAAVAEKRREKARELIDEATRLRDEDKFDAARECLSEARSTASDAADWKALFQEITRREDAARSRERVEGLLDDARTLAARGDLEAALRHVESAEKAADEESMAAVAELRQELLKRQQQEREKEQERRKRAERERRQREEAERRKREEAERRKREEAERREREEAERREREEEERREREADVDATVVADAPPQDDVDATVIADAPPRDDVDSTRLVDRKGTFVESGEQPAAEDRKGTVVESGEQPAAEDRKGTVVESGEQPAAEDRKGTVVESSERPAAVDRTVVESDEQPAAEEDRKGTVVESDERPAAVDRTVVESDEQPAAADDRKGTVVESGERPAAVDRTVVESGERAAAEDRKGTVVESGEQPAAAEDRKGTVVEPKKAEPDKKPEPDKKAEPDEKAAPKKKPAAAPPPPSARRKPAAERRSAGPGRTALGIAAGVLVAVAAGALWYVLGGGATTSVLMIRQPLLTVTGVSGEALPADWSLEESCPSFFPGQDGEAAYCESPVELSLPPGTYEISYRWKGADPAAAPRTRPVEVGTEPTVFEPDREIVEEQLDPLIDVLEGAGGGPD